MLPPAALDAADRLVTTLMTLVHAVAQIAKTGSTSTFPELAAHTLFIRLARLVTHLIRISNFGVPAPSGTRARTPAPVAPPLRPTSRASSLSLPRRPGWLLDALPDTAPAIAVDLGTLLADPAFATLLDTAPTLRRALNPLLRGLGLAAAPPNPPPSAHPAQRPAARTAAPSPPPTRLRRPGTGQSLPPRKSSSPDARPPHVHFVPLTVNDRFKAAGSRPRP